MSPIAMSSSEHIYTNDTEVAKLDIEEGFNSLTKEEQLYAHYLSKAAWFGSLAVFFQTSVESPLIFTFFHRIVKKQSLDQLRQLATELDENEWKALLVYLSAFLANSGNYRGFGDQKFIPDLPKNKLEDLVTKTKAFNDNKEEMSWIWDQIKDKMYSLEKNELVLGFPPNGVTTYFSKNCTEDDSKLVKQWLELNRIDAYNTRVFKDSERKTFEVRMASVLTTDDSELSDYLRNNVKTDEFNGYKFFLSRGDYSEVLKLCDKYLVLAEKSALNDTERQMIGEYRKHFMTGDLDYHKQGSRFWIKDKGPIIETYIGFIENDRDPAGQRAEFEAFVSIVNKEMSKKFETLVQSAEQMLPLLPWPKSFEKNRFLRPDFTSLEVLTFSTSGIPAGINIPNYDEIRQNEGFKNVSLGNVINASLIDKKRQNFLSEEDSDLTKKYLVPSFEVQVGLHELLGHGSGKLLKEEADGRLNFDPVTTVSPLTGQPVTNWYKSGQGYDSVFSDFSSAYEECRAECVGLYLCLEPTVLEIFGHTDKQEAEDVVFVNWLSMAHKGVESLKMYNPDSKKWSQAHSQARYVILRVLLRAVPEMVSIQYLKAEESEDGKEDLRISFKKDMDLIRSKGKEAIGHFLLQLQVFKSCADIDSARKLFEDLSAVSDDLEYPFLYFRDIALNRKKPEKLFVQSDTSLACDGSVQLKTYGETHEELIGSFVDHLSAEESIDQIVVDLWRKDSKHFA